MTNFLDKACFIPDRVHSVCKRIDLYLLGYKINADSCWGGKVL